MNLRNSFKTAARGLNTHRSRAALTVLGIVIGITAVILIMSMGRAAQDLILGQIQALGSKTIVVVPGREPAGPSDFAQIFSDSLREKDLDSLQKKENVPSVRDVMPLVFGPVQLSYRGETYRTTMLGGGSTDTNGIVGRVFDVYPERGRFFSAEEVKSKGSVAVIGDKVRRELFGPGRDPLGEKFKLNGKNFRVVGILAPKGQVSFFNFDDIVMVPYTTAQQYVLGRKHFDRILVVASSDDAVRRAAEDITLTLRSNHEIDDPAKDDFFVQTQADLAARISSITSILTLFLSSVAAISLIVGGIGIMNIMLVSVVERTREIGLRKAIGATDRDILLQFLFEAVILTGIGGIIGIILGSALALAAALVLSRGLHLAWSFSLPLSAVALGLGVAAMVGFVFGLYPARSAARKSPIEALRSE